MRCLVGNLIEPFEEFDKNLIEVVRQRGFDIVSAPSLQIFLQQLQSAAETFDLFFFDLGMLDGLNEEMRFRFGRVRERLKKPVVGIAYLPDEAKELVLKLKLDQLICKYFSSQQIWYVLNSVLSKESQSRRRWPRYLLDLPVEVAIEEELRCGESFDVGGGGLFVKTYEPLGHGSRLQVRFRIPAIDRLVDCQGRVVFSRSFNPLEKFMQPPGMGIEFIDIDQDLQQRISDFLIGLYGFISR